MRAAEIEFKPKGNGKGRPQGCNEPQVLTACWSALVLSLRLQQALTLFCCVPHLLLHTSL